jgi:hypothetical protein
MGIVAVAVHTAACAFSGYAAAATYTLAPTRDSYVTAASPKRNFGAAHTLREGSTPDARSYLRFDLTGVVGKLRSARLHLYSHVSSSAGYAARGAGNRDFGEGSITYRNAPAVTAETGGVSGPIAVGSTSVDVAPFISDPTALTVVLVSTSVTQIRLASREGPAPPPRLEIVTETTAPAVTLTTPAHASTVTTPTPTLGGTAGTAVGDSSTITVNLYAGAAAAGTPVQVVTATATDGSWSASASPLAPGTYTAQAEQIGDAGHVGRSGAITFTVSTDAVDTEPPTVSLTTPEDGATVGTASPSFSGAAGAAAGDLETVTVHVYAGSAAAGTPVQALTTTHVGGSWSVTAAAALPDGPYTAQAEQSDAAGNTGRSAATTFSVEVVPSAACWRSSRYSEVVLGSVGLVGYWRLGDGGASACDAVGTSAGVYRAGALVGQPGAIVDDADTAVSLNGSTGWVEVADAPLLDVGDRFSVEAWVKRAGVGTNQVIVSKQSNSWVLMFSSGSRLVLRKATVGDIASSTVTLTDVSGWHHVAASKEGASVRLYVDGVDVTGGVTNSTLADNALPLAIGQSSSVSFFHGSVDEVAVYNRVLTAAEISQRYRTALNLQPPANDPVIAAVGDIACSPFSPDFNGGLGTPTNCRQKYTSDLLIGTDLAAVLLLGDLQYECGGATSFAQSYHPSWGRLNAIARPVPGNHEYQTTGSSDCDTTGTARPYFDYFGAAAGDPTRGFYSYDVGTWHVVALNTNNGCVKIACGAGSTQEQWLRAELASRPTTCTLAYWHHPLYSSTAAGSGVSRALWQALYEAGADVVLAGHAHSYERFAPQNANGGFDGARGLRQFVVGTGGVGLHSFATTAGNSEARNNTTHGVLKLTLRPSGYDWSFVPETGAGSGFADSGSGSCH